MKASSENILSWLVGGVLCDFFVFPIEGNRQSGEVGWEWGIGGGWATSQSQFRSSLICLIHYSYHLKFRCWMHHGSELLNKINLVKLYRRDDDTSGTLDTLKSVLAGVYV